VARNPLVPPALVARRPVAAGTFVLFVATALMVAMFFLGTFFLQDVRGHGPLATGLLFLPLAAAPMLGAQAGERLFAGFGARTLAVGGLLVTAVGLLVASAGDATALKVVAAGVASAGLGALFVVASVTSLNNVEPHQAGTASGLLSTFHELGAASGAAVMSGVVGAGLAAESLAAIERGYLVAGAVAAGGALVAAVLVPGRPRGTESGDAAASERPARSEERRADVPST
jgi:MFS family permease